MKERKKENKEGKKKTNFIKTLNSTNRETRTSGQILEECWNQRDERSPEGNCCSEGSC